MTTCPSCGIAGNNFNCPNHIYWGINPLPDSIPMPEQPAWASLYAEIGRLNVLLNERDKEIAALKQTSADLCSECGWRFLVPGIGCQGCERARLEQEIEWLRGERPAVVAYLRQPSEHPDPTRIITMRADEWARRVNANADFIESGGHRKEETEE